MSNPIQFSLNGDLTKASCRADMTVLEWLRGEALLRGTKEGCAEGDCGACSVLVKRAGQKEKYLPANSCIMLMGQLEGASLLTVEGLAATGDGGHIVQQCMAENGSSQCGFCTPGIVVALAGLLERNAEPDESEIHDALAGNLCRCTGYRPIVEAAQAAAKEKKLKLPTGKSINTSAQIGNADSEFLAPKTLDELLALKKKHKHATLLAGGTDLAIDVAHARARWPRTISTRSVSELREINRSKTSLTFGGAVTWEEALPHLQKHWPSFATLVRRFGSTQIRSMGTIAGNLATASPIGDGAPALLALGATIHLANAEKKRSLPLEKFFLDYRKSALKPDEVITGIEVSLPSKAQTFRAYKVSKRYDQDISTVCGAFALEMKGDKIAACRIAFGGMAATPMRCMKAEKALTGSTLSSGTIDAGKRAIAETFSPMTDMRGTADYRAMVASNLLQRLALDIAGEDVEVMAL